MADRPRIEVLLATYNSARFLRPMLQSLATQTERDFHLVVSDDRSGDETVAILESMRDTFANPVEIRRRDTPSGSAMANFAGLLEAATGDYVLLADHDDIWHPDHIARAVARLRDIEARHGAATPILTHCDLRIIDGEGHETGETLWRLKAIDPAYGTRLNTALLNATVTGCAAAMNRALVTRAGRVPAEAIMHDWWLNLVAAAFGVVDADPEPGVFYRIHGSNVSNPTRVSVTAMARRRAMVQVLRDKMARRLRQGQAFGERFGATLPPAQQRILHDFTAIDGAGFVRRRLLCLRGGFRFPDPWRTAALWLLL